jgi:hypothetical protein
LPPTNSLQKLQPRSRKPDLKLKLLPQKLKLMLMQPLPQLLLKPLRLQNKEQQNKKLKMMQLLLKLLLMQPSLMLKQKLMPLLLNRREY